MTATRHADDRAGPTAYGWYVGCTMMLVSVISMLDRKALVMLAEPIKHDLSLSDAQLGLLTGGLFSVVYAAGSFPLARLADRFSRARIIGTCLIAWSMLTAAGGFATGFVTLAGSRVGVALGEAGASPASYALLTNHFAPASRGRAYALIAAGAPLGILFGLMLGGILNDLVGWRTALLVIGLPGALVGLLILLTVRDRLPVVRAGVVPHDPAQGSFGRTARLFVHDPVLRNLLAGAAFLFLSVGATNALFAPYLMRRFAISAGAIGTGYGLALGLSGFAGSLIGGWLTDRFGARRADLPLRLFSIAVLLVLALTVARLLADDYHLVLVIVAAETLLAALYAAPTFATLQARVHDAQRSMATAIMLFGINGVGASLGPLAAGAISDALAHGGATSATTLRIGLLSTAPALLVAAFFYRRAAGHCRAVAAAG